MAGFEEVENAEATLKPASDQQSIDDLLQILTPPAEAITAGENELPAGQQEAVPSGQESQEPIEQLGQQLGEEQPPVETSEQVDTEQTFTLKVNGEDREVTLNELKQGFQLKSDYTRKQQELATQRDQLASQAQQNQAQHDEYSNMVDTMRQRLQTLIPEEPDWIALANANPQEHARQRAAWDNLNQQVKTVEAEQNRLAMERQQQFQNQYAGYLQQENARLLERKPELADGEKRKTFFDQVVNYAVHEYGFSAQEVNSIADHRLLMLADKARLYDEIQKGTKGKAVVSGAHVPTLPAGPAAATGKPTAAGNLLKAKSRLARTGSTKDAAAAIEAMG